MSDNIHYYTLGATPHAMDAILREGSIKSTTEWDDVTCGECMASRPYSMVLHDEGCVAVTEPGTPCECKAYPVAGW